MNTNQEVVDGQFLDSYGNLVKHGSRIIIESNYNNHYLNGREAVVEWDGKRGMYKYTITDPYTHRADFWGIHSFKLISQ